MMIKMMVFDLDNTLCEVDREVLPENIALLRELEQQGIQIALASGKPTYYLCGFLRQVGLQDPIMVGENGCVIHMGVDLPPKGFYILPHTQKAKDSLALLQREIAKLLPHIWFQPSIVEVSPFTVIDEEFEAIEALIAKLDDQLGDITIYRHCDCFDILPDNIDKGTGVAYLADLLGITADEIIAVGDSINDFPLFAYAGHSVGVNCTEPERVDRNFTSTNAALSYLLEIAKSQKA